MTGAPTRVRIRFSSKVARRVRRRRWHPTQQFANVGRGEVEMTMDVSGTVELSRWVMTWGSEAKVLEPQTLRDELAEEARAMAAIYGTPDLRVVDTGVREISSSNEHNGARQ